jgi:peptidoglycan/LPS O-acetylase OafA/YrhL
MEPKVSSRLDLLQVLRGLAALSVVLVHDRVKVPGPTAHYLTLWQNLGVWGWIGVDVFFCLSGFIMVWVHGDDIGLPQRAPAFAAKRFFRIYPPYAILTLAVLIFESATALLGHAAWRSPEEIIESIFLFPSSGYGLLLAVAWTLVYEVFFYVLFCGAIILGRRIALIGAVLWCAGIVFYPHPPYGTTSQICDFVFNPINLEFLVGAATAILVRKFPCLPLAWAALAAGILLLVGGFVFGWWHDFVGEGITPGVLEKMALAMVCSAVIFGLARIELSGQVRPPAFAVFLGTASYSIYLIHGNVIRWLGYLLLRAFPHLADRSLPGQGLLILLAAAGIGAGIAYYHFVERPILSRTRHWLRDRREKQETGRPSDS